VTADLVYLDATAIVKLVVHEAESTALLDHIGTAPHVATSVMGVVEVARALARAKAPESVMKSWDAVRRGLDLVPFGPATAARAETLGPPLLRALDAVHVASALDLQPHVREVVTYDARMGHAARAAGLTVVSPS
jgi:predicted nucleic acid-binding protein